MASTDKTPSAERISERVGDLLAASERRVRELEAEVVRLQQEKEAALAQGYGHLRRQLEESEGRVERLREALRLHHEVGPAPDTDGTPCPACGAVASPDKPPERVVRTTITDLDAFK